MECNKYVDKLQGRGQDFFPKVPDDFLNPLYLFACLFVKLFIHLFIYLLIYFFYPGRLQVRTCVLCAQIATRFSVKSF